MLDLPCTKNIKEVWYSLRQMFFFTNSAIVFFDLSPSEYNILFKVQLKNSEQDLSPKLHKREYLPSTNKNFIFD